MVLGVAFFGLQVAAMAAPNFAGSWVRDNAKSEPVPNALMLNRAPAVQGGGGGQAGRGGGPPVVVPIEQNATSLTVNDPQNGYRKYPLDGKPLTRRTEQGITNATVTGAPQGADTMVFTTTQPYGGMPGNNTLTVKEVWTLSPDGKVLTITTTRTIPAVEKTYKVVYNKQ